LGVILIDKNLLNIKDNNITHKRYIKIIIIIKIRILEYKYLIEIESFGCLKISKRKDKS